MSSPRISIITATFNSEKVLQRCIDSVKQQTYQNIQYIIIDGASTDKTLEIISNNKEDIHRYISEKDKGVYDAWNKGIRLAEGEWIIFIGSDDVLYPSAIEDYVNFINLNNQHFDFVSSRVHIINRKEVIIRNFGWRWDWQISKRFCTIAHPGAFHRKTLFLDHGNFDISYKICGDYEFLLRAGKNLRAGFMDKFTLKMEVGGLSDSTAVYFEHFNAVTTTGGLNKLSASIDFLNGYSKFIVKRFFRYFGVNIALKK